MAQPKKTIEQLKAAGNYRPSRHGEEHPEAKGLPIAPSWLSVEAVKTFYEVSEFCREMNIGVGQQDSYLIALLANTLDQYLIHDEALKKEGLVIEQSTDRGQVQKRPNPHIGLQNTAIKQIHSILNDLGLTPVARSRFNVNQAEKNDKTVLGQFLAAGKGIRGVA